MSLGGPDFVASLAGRTTTILVEGRQTNLALARLLVSASSKAGRGCRVLDLDAFYSSNAELIAGGQSIDGRSVLLQVPDPGAQVAPRFAELVSGDEGVLIVDSLNSLNHLMSRNGRSLSFAVAALSSYAGANDVAAVLSMYRRGGPPRSGKGGTIAALSDAEVHAKVDDGKLVLECARGDLWSEKRLTFST